MKMHAGRQTGLTRERALTRSFVADAPVTVGEQIEKRGIHQRAGLGRSPNTLKLQ